jgi:hypothetical protein
MRRLVGPLDLTEGEIAEFRRTEKWPFRTVEAPGPPGPPEPLPPVPAEKDLFELGATVRDYWHADGKHKGIQEGLKEGLERGQLEGLEKGKTEGRESVLRENLTEALQAVPRGAEKLLNNDRDVSDDQKRARLGRPSSLEKDISEMIKIIGDNPERGKEYCRNLFKRSLPYTETGSKTGESDLKRWPNERSKRAWDGAQKILTSHEEEKEGKFSHL